MPHKTELDNYKGTLPELAREIANLRYDTLANLFEELYKCIDEDAQKDYDKGRKNLGMCLGMNAYRLKEATDSFKRAWLMCAPYMKEDKRTSQEWAILCTHIILDPDGWDRSNYQYSWYEEKITRKEFEDRLILSTIQPTQPFLTPEGEPISIWKDLKK